MAVHAASDRFIARQGDTKRVLCAMNKTIGVQLLVYSLLLGGLSYLVHQLAPTLAQATLIAGLAGGALCLIWSLRAIAGSRGKALPILTLIPVTFVMLSQTVVAWTGGGQDVPGRGAAAGVITVLLVLSIAMLMRIAYAGVVFGVQTASPTKDAGGKSQATGKPAIQADAKRRS
jgi:hypothetical protein